MKLRNPQWRFFLGQALLNGGVFALIMTLFDLAAGDPVLVWKVLFYFLFFGLLMGYFYLAQTRAELRRLGISPDSPEAWKTHHRRTIVSTVAPAALRRMLEAEKWVRKIREEGEGIRLTTRPTARGWGERVELSVESLPDGSYRYELSSRPRLFPTMVDFGKNLENLQRLEAMLKAPQPQPN